MIWNTVFWIIVIAIMSGLGMLFSGEVSNFGTYIGSSQLQTDWLLAVGWATVIGGFLALVPLPRQEKRVLIWLWLIRAIFSLVVSLWYEDHYDSLDAFGYFTSSSGEWKDWSIGMGSGTENITAICWLHQCVFPGCYHVMKISFSAIGLLGIWIFYLAGKQAFPEQASVKLLWFLGAIPSVAFWSSIVGKDPIMLFAVGLYAYGICLWSRSKMKQGVWAIILGILIGAFIRLWIAPVLCVPFVYLALSAISDVRRKFFYGIVSLCLLSIGIYSMADMFGIDSLTGAVSQANSISKWWVSGGSAQSVDEVDSVSGIGAALPWWMFSFLFRPFPWEIPNQFAILSGIENFLFLGLAGWMVINIRISHLRDPIVGWMILMIVVYTAVFSVAGFQNLGTAVRWKLPVIPFQIGLASYLMSRRSMIHPGEHVHGDANAQIVQG